MCNESIKYDITFICRRGKDHFAEPILSELAKTYTIQYLYPEHKRDLLLNQIKGKIIWVEWAHKFAKIVSKKKWKNKKVFVRLHRYEIDTDYMKKIKWQNIDRIIFVNSHFEKEFKQKINNTVETITIPNAISIDDFKLNSPKNNKNICSYSLTFNRVKGYIDLLILFSKLLKKDDSYRLNILARYPINDKESSYLLKIEKKMSDLKLKNSVIITKRKLEPNLSDDRKNISKYLSQQNLIISFSKLESFHYSFAEGLLCGLQGFYNAWENPLIKEFWNKWGYNSEDDMIAGILQWSNLSLKDKEKIVQENRNYVIKNFGANNIAKVYENEFFS